MSARLISFTFTEWLVDQGSRDDAVGDFAGDASRDPDWPADADRRELHHYLKDVGACHAAHDALDQAWAEWRARQDRPRIHVPRRDGEEPPPA
jgi:YozE SAM-like fold